MMVIRHRRHSLPLPTAPHLFIQPGLKDEENKIYVYVHLSSGLHCLLSVHLPAERKFVSSFLLKYSTIVEVWLNNGYIF